MAAKGLGIIPEDLHTTAIQHAGQARQIWVFVGRVRVAVLRNTGTRFSIELSGAPRPLDRMAWSLSEALDVVCFHLNWEP